MKCLLYGKLLRSQLWYNGGLIHIELSDYFDYVEHCDVFFTIVMLMLVCHNSDSYSGFKDPLKIISTLDVFINYVSRCQGIIKDCMIKHIYWDVIMWDLGRTTLFCVSQRDYILTTSSLISHQIYLEFIIMTILKIVTCDIPKLRYSLKISQSLTPRDGVTRYIIYITILELK